MSRELVPVAIAAARIEREGRELVLGHLTPDDLESFVPIDPFDPHAPVYLAIDVDLGAGSRNVPPETALRDILEAGRSPLTLDEGIALVLQQPDAIARNWGFSMAGSRAAINAFLHSGSARNSPSSAGAGTATLIAGSALPRARTAPLDRR